ncbi:MAG TPA: hypothetical protein VI796_06385 [Candidatus Thermoplasmatota archaeon]|nr:hypothetical protein [Candidatus Thermoplasmatota archaeon]
MKAAAALAILVAATATSVALPAAAEPTAATGPDLTVLIYHPYPDDADPLGFGFPAGGQRDAFWARYGSQAPGTAFPYPYTVVDGLHAVAGIPDQRQPFESTREAYAASVRDRLAAEPPATLVVNGSLDGNLLRVEVEVDPNGPLDRADLRLWVAVTEDHVAYKPPPRLSNGVFDHRFTVRAMEDAGQVDLAAGNTVHRTAGFTLDPDWSRGQLSVAAWLEENPEEATFHPDRLFAPHEVVQSALHRVDSPAATRQEGKAVLLEMLSATWCDPCLYGDTAADDLAREHGVPDVAPLTADSGYLRRPLLPPALAAALSLAAGGAVVALAVRRRP